jgi:hypothetical protein
MNNESEHQAPQQAENEPLGWNTVRPPFSIAWMSLLSAGLAAIVCSAAAICALDSSPARLLSELIAVAMPLAVILWPTLAICMGWAYKRGKKMRPGTP